MRSPLRFPDQVDFDFAHLGNAGQPVVDLLEDEAARRALRSRQGHGDFDALAWEGRRGVGIGLDGHVVDQAQIDKIQLHFRVEEVVQRGSNVLGGAIGQLLGE